MAVALHNILRAFISNVKAVTTRNLLRSLPAAGPAVGHAAHALSPQELAGVNLDPVPLTMTS